MKARQARKTRLIVISDLNRDIVFKIHLDILWFVTNLANWRQHIVVFTVTFGPSSSWRAISPSWRPDISWLENCVFIASIHDIDIITTSKYGSHMKDDNE
jgi:hypothetical protein